MSDEAQVKRGRPAKAGCAWDGDSTSALLAHLRRLTDAVEAQGLKLDGLIESLKARGGL